MNVILEITEHCVPEILRRLDKSGVVDFNCYDRGNGEDWLGTLLGR